MADSHIKFASSSRRSSDESAMIIQADDPDSNELSKGFRCLLSTIISCNCSFDDAKRALQKLVKESEISAHIKDMSTLHTPL